MAHRSVYMNVHLQPKTLENKWVVLKPLSTADYDALYHVASDPRIWEQHPNPNRYQKPVFHNFFVGALESGGAMVIQNGRSGEVIGSSRFYDYDAAASELKIGYTFFARHCWGKPYNRFSKLLMLDHAFGFVTRVIFHVGSQNIRSRKAMEKLGAETVGEVSVAYYGEPERMNTIYQIEKEKWEVLRQNLLS